eukprot:TRINITY_DN13289_c0_g1_i6.p1 TRINITY_DN13289_c0_g1~~TRINITY_DN13289_c0_g1_i6.p1  ORF type:complete len:173 (+),score=21.58 TRINITY_DN13289_c0_g1_i6:145-663(+)
MESRPRSALSLVALSHGVVFGSAVAHVGPTVHEGSPGPAYNIEEKRGLSGYSMGSGHREVDVVKGPGPGAYDSRSCASEAGFAFGKEIAHKGPAVTTTHGPGPAYSPQEPQKRVVGGVLGSGHKGPNTVDTPGPGTYTHGEQTSVGVVFGSAVAHVGPAVRRVQAELFLEAL